MDALDRCTVNAPRAGTVLQVNARVGEFVSSVQQWPLFLLSDLSERRVRAEVDERHATRVRVGQAVRISFDEGRTADLWGTVIDAELAMGRKSVRSTDPAEKSDRDKRI